MQTPESRKFEIEATTSTFDELCQQLLRQIVQYEENLNLNHRTTSFKKNKFLAQVEQSLKKCFNEPESGQYGLINYLPIERSTGAWFNFWSQETTTDDYILFRGYGDTHIYLIALDPTFSHHTSKGYVKQSKIYITLAAIKIENSPKHHLTLYHFKNKSKSQQKDDSNKRCHVSPKRFECVKQDRNSFYQHPLVLFPFSLSKMQVEYKYYPQRWFIQSANSENTTCWLKRSVYLSRHDGPLESLPSINRPIAVSTSNNFIVIYPCRFGDLVNLLYSKESYYLRYWITKNPIEILKLIRLILEPITHIHKHRADINNYTIARGKKLYKNISWPPFKKYMAQNESDYLVHTDIKLDNFLFQPDMIYNCEAGTTSISFTFKVEITDFDGLAYEGQQMQGNATPGYLSPQMKESYIQGECYYVNQLDDSFSSGEMLDRIAGVLLPVNHPNYRQMYLGFLEPIIAQLKEIEPSKRMQVTDAYNKICKYIETFNPSTGTHMEEAQIKHNQETKIETSQDYQNYDESTFPDSLNKSDKRELSDLHTNSYMNNSREITESTECVSSLYRKSRNLSQQETTNITSTFGSDVSELNTHTLTCKDIPNTSTHTNLCENLNDKQIYVKV